MTQLSCLRHTEAEDNLRRTTAPSLDSPSRLAVATRRRPPLHNCATAPQYRCVPALRPLAIETATLIAAPSGFEVVVPLAGLNEVEIGP